MTVATELKLDNRFKQRLVTRYQRYTFEAGILDDKAYRQALPASRGLSSLEGGPVRKRSGNTKGTVADVGEKVRKTHGVDYLRAPVKKPKSKEMVAFKKAFFDFVSDKNKAKEKVETALRAVIRVPILRKRYGRNSKWWAKVKTFNRKLFDTGQFYRAITAKVRRTRRV